MLSKKINEPYEIMDFISKIYSVASQDFVCGWGWGKDGPHNVDNYFVAPLFSL